MLDGLLHIFTRRPWMEVIRDLLDVFIVAYFVYRALLILRGTRAMQMGAGLLVIFLVYLGAKALELVTLINLMSWLLSSIILVVVVVFQNDIRRALVRVGGQAWWAGGKKQEQTRVLDEVIAAVTELARHRIGAIIAFELDANLLEFTKSEGVPIGSQVSRELLVAMFYPESVNKLHDGAVIIRDLKIERAGVFFPMPDVKIRDAALGSRHRAAIGITEETDAVVVVVSEERGTISVCFGGNIVPNLDGTAVRDMLNGFFGERGRGKKRRGPSIRPGAPTSTGRATLTPSVPAPPPRPRASATTTPIRASDVRAELRDGRTSDPPPPPADRPSPDPVIRGAARERLTVPMPMPTAAKKERTSLPTPTAKTPAPTSTEDERSPESARGSFVPGVAPGGGALPGGEER